MPYIGNCWGGTHRALEETYQRRHERRRGVADFLTARQIACQAGKPWRTLAVMRRHVTSRYPALLKYHGDLTEDEIVEFLKTAKMAIDREHEENNKREQAQEAQQALRVKKSKPN